ncbi:MAG: EamA family transporter [Patescibacteria group bacterium]
MAVVAILYVALGAVFAALYNVGTKKVQTGEWKNRSSALVALHLGMAAVMLLSWSAATGGPALTEGLEPFLWPMIATGVLNIGIMLAKMRARALEDVSLVTPIDSTTPAIVIVTSMLILGEYPSRLGWIGILLLVLGTYILNIQDVGAKLAERLSKEKEGRPVPRWRVYLAPFLALKGSVGVRWAFLAVGLSTISLNFDGLVARRANIAFGLGCVVAIAALGNLGVALWRKEFHGVTVRDAAVKSLPLAALWALSNGITNLAYRESIVPYVGTMKRLQIPLTIILAYWLLDERKSFRERFAGGLVMTIGAVLIGLG